MSKNETILTVFCCCAIGNFIASCISGNYVGFVERTFFQGLALFIVASWMREPKEPK